MQAVTLWVVRVNSIDKSVVEHMVGNSAWHITYAALRLLRHLRLLLPLRQLSLLLLCGILTLHRSTDFVLLLQSVHDHIVKVFDI